LRSPLCGLVSWTVAAGTDTPPGPRTWPLIDPVVGLWAENTVKGENASAKKTLGRTMRLVRLAAMGSENLPYKS